MVQFDGLRPARLKVGIISAGRVGTALGVALERVDHVVVACSAVSRASRHRAERWLPDTPVSPVPDVAGNADVLRQDDQREDVPFVEEAALQRKKLFGINHALGSFPGILKCELPG